MNWIESGLVHQVGWTLIHFLWEGSILAGLLALLLWATKGRSPRLRYGLACFVLMAMLVAPILTWYQLGRTSVASQLIEESFTLPSKGEHKPTPPNIPATISAWISHDRDWDGLLPIGVGLWLLGVSVMSLRLASGWTWLQWLRRRPDTVPADDEVQLRLLRLCQRMNLASNIRILLCNKVPGPTVLGWLRPVILLPPAALLGMSLEQIELVLAHELAHILRHDFAVNLLQSCIEVLLFYHPAVWWVSSKIRQERELCCDDLAVQVTGDALDYAAALTRLEALCRQSNPPQQSTQALALGATGGSLMHRIRRLISPIAPTPLAPRAGIVMLLLISGVFALQARAALHPQSPPPVQDQMLPEGTILLRRYDRDSTDNKRKAGTIDLNCQIVTVAELEQALNSLDQMPKDLSKGWVEFQMKANLPRTDQSSLWSYKFLGCPPARARRIILARSSFPYLAAKDKKPGQIIIQRLANFTYELGVLPQGLHVNVWAGDVPAEEVLQALNELMAKQPDGGIPQEVRRQVNPSNALGQKISLDIVDEDPLKLWSRLDGIVKEQQH